MKRNSRNRIFVCLSQLLIFVGSTIVFSLSAQSDSTFILPDTARAFSIENFYFFVTTHHPVAKQAELLSEVARQEIRLARGNFDPRLELQYQRKNFNDTEYYKILNGSLSFPVIFPIDPKVGVERNEGVFLNPERYISDQFNYKQFYAGISLPLGRGLITDERRTALRQAELFRDMTEAEQVRIINNLLLDAAKEYWSWYDAYYNYRLLNRGVRVASDIFRRTKINAALGEAAPIDTVQAKITLLHRVIEQQEALLSFQNTSIQLNTYLWDSLGNPSNLPVNFAPVLDPRSLVLSPQALEELTEGARVNHPDLRKLNVRLEQLEVDRKLALEFLKPRLDLNYNLLNQPFDPAWNSTFNLGENYKFGLDFSFPVLIRKERSRLALTKLRINTTTYDRNLTERMIINEINTTHNTLVYLAGILQNQADMVRNYELLLQAELLNFVNGESDLFKINIQQEKLIQSQTKQLKLMADYEKQKAMLYWAAGLRGLNP